MKRLGFVALVGLLLAVVVVHAAGNDSHQRAAAVERHGSPIQPDPAASVTSSPGTGAAVAVAVAARVGGIEAVPAVVEPARPATPLPVGPDDGADSGDDGTPTDGRLASGDVAAGWALERWRDSSTPDALPKGALHRIWTTDPTLIAAATAAGPHADRAVNQTISATVTAVDDSGGGWWSVQLAVKTTADGQIGVATSTAVVQVHIGPNGLVDADSDLAPT